MFSGFIYFVSHLERLFDNIDIVSFDIRTFACDWPALPPTLLSQLIRAPRIGSAAEFSASLLSLTASSRVPAPPIGLSGRSRASARSGSRTLGSRAGPRRDMPESDRLIGDSDRPPCQEPLPQGPSRLGPVPGRHGSGRGRELPRTPARVPIRARKSVGSAKRNLTVGSGATESTRGTGRPSPGHLPEASGWTVAALPEAVGSKRRPGAGMLAEPRAA